MSKPSGSVAETALRAAWPEFKKKNGTEEVEASITQGPIEESGMSFKIEISVRLIPCEK